jgi:NAD-dependent deacetylase sirtuin 5
MQVIPAATFAEIVKNNGGKIAVFNVELNSQSMTADFAFIGPCEETLVKALGLENRIGSWS